MTPRSNIRFFFSRNLFRIVFAALTCLSLAAGAAYAQQKTIRQQLPSSDKPAITAGTDATNEKSTLRPSRPAVKTPVPKAGKSSKKKVDPAQVERERQEIAKKNGVRLWPELTDEQQKSFVKKQKDFLVEVQKKVPAGEMQLYETNFFLFYSDISPMYVKMYVPYLDTMYKMLCNAFGLDAKKNLFQGKCLVIAFAQEASFHQFEIAFYEKPKIGAQGLCHCNGNGEVVMACFAGRDPQYFASVMVHETSHGFMFRYLSNKNIPNWLNEGAAEWIAKHVVTRDQAIPRKIQKSILQMRQMGSMGGNFFSTEHIENWQYGLAAHLTEFLLQYDAQSYKQMIDDIKLGKPWQEALADAYQLTPAELAKNYGLWIGLPMLAP
jgi:hypothetical protein